MSRPRIKRNIAKTYSATSYKPQGIKSKALNSIVISHDQIEALRLADVEKMEQIDAAEIMNISRSTFSRLLNEARNIVAKAITNNWILNIKGGNFEVCNNLDNRDKKMPNYDGTDPLNKESKNNKNNNCGCNRKRRCRKAEEKYNNECQRSN